MSKLPLLLALTAATIAASPLAAQSGGDGAPPVERAPRTERVERTERDDQRSRDTGVERAAPASDVRSLLGVVLSTSGNARDTIGLLVSVIVPGGAAERAGIEEGNRIATINGVNLRLAPEAIGDRDAADAITRRLERELDNIRPGDEVQLRVVSGGRSRTVNLEAGSSTRASVPSSNTARDGGRDSEPPAPTLAEIAASLAKLQQQINELAAREQVPGLEVSPVADEMVAYFGEGSESGLLVLKADQKWSPLRPGDVILRVDDQVVTIDRLRAAPGARRPATIELIRRKRILTVRLGD